MAKKEDCREKIAGWIMKPGVLGYIIDSYAGTERSSRGPNRRVFEWEDGSSVYRGNAEAFILHLGTKFSLELKPEHACYVHALLREFGEVVLPSKGGKKMRDMNSPFRGRFRQPDPDKRKVR